MRVTYEVVLDEKSGKPRAARSGGRRVGGARESVCGASRAVEGCGVRDVRGAGWSVSMYTCIYSYIICIYIYTCTCTCIIVDVFLKLLKLTLGVRDTPIER